MTIIIISKSLHLGTPGRCRNSAATFYPLGQFCEVDASLPSL